MEDKRTADLFRDNPEEAERFIEIVNALAGIWPIWGFRCNGQSYIVNQDEIDRELARRKERYGREVALGGIRIYGEVSIVDAYIRQQTAMVHCYRRKAYIHVAIRYMIFRFGWLLAHTLN